MSILFWIIIVLLVIFVLAGIRIVKPTQKGLVERLGKYKKCAGMGFHWIIPVIDSMRKVNITEQMIDADRQTTAENMYNMIERILVVPPDLNIPKRDASLNTSNANAVVRAIVRPNCTL